MVLHVLLLLLLRVGRLLLRGGVLGVFHWGACVLVGGRDDVFDDGCVLFLFAIARGALRRLGLLNENLWPTLLIYYRLLHGATL